MSTNDVRSTSNYLFILKLFTALVCGLAIFQVCLYEDDSISYRRNLQSLRPQKILPAKYSETDHIDTAIHPLAKRKKTNIFPHFGGGIIRRTPPANLDRVTHNHFPELGTFDEFDGKTGQIIVQTPKPKHTTENTDV